MKNRKIFKIGMLCITFFIVIATYIWYLYFKEFEGEVLLSTNVRLELINSGAVEYIDAIVDDEERNIPTYYFRVKNSVDVPVYYDILIKDVSASEANDGCSAATLFAREELDFELKLDNKVIRKGSLSEIQNDLLDSNKMDSSGVKDYAIRIYLNEKAKNSLTKHYHYVINLRERNEIPS